jgi:Rad3-related DNA helicase
MLVFFPSYTFMQ